jgi:hypothetical protein
MRVACRFFSRVALLLLLSSCGGGGGGGGGDTGGGVVTPLGDKAGVFSGFNGSLDWEASGGGSDGVGAGADGDGGAGAGGDFGQFKGALVVVFREDGSEIGRALTDDVKGMITIYPGRTYRGTLTVELRGQPGATYYEEGRDTTVPFPEGKVIRVAVSSIKRNIGITPFTEAAYRLLTEGSTPERVASGRPTAAQIQAANDRVAGILNQHFPTVLQVDDITRLPFIKAGVVAPGSISTDPRGRYGMANGAFSKQAAIFNSDSATPTLDATAQLSTDLLDGQLDGRNGTAPAADASKRTYEPNTLTGELSSALAQQADRFGNQLVKDALPAVLNFGNTRYEGYLFDGSLRKTGDAYSTVAGWVGGNSLNRNVGDPLRKLPNVARVATFTGNFGHGGGYFKADATDGSRAKVYALGDNVNGELGLGNKTSTAGLALEVALPGALTHAAGGFAHTVARMADGKVYAWGDNSFGQLGQSPTALPSASTPQQVPGLPAVGAVAVAATSVASYALMADGTVWAWGSNGGFALLGNNQAEGLQSTPTAVAGLTDVTQISARDNDVVVVKRDNTVWFWGSHPADVNAYTPGDLAGAYRGGSQVPTQVTGLPAGVAVRKILTEQGLFAALLANGHVYSWGVYFDITAGTTLRDLVALRVLGLPPVRDAMPGGFVGYGVRPFDRLTAMGVDYSGGMWKIRGRVAERFDPTHPEIQRRPQGQGARPDCISCHTYLNSSLEQLLATAPATANLAACVPPSSVHQSGGAPLIHAETDCVQCHNPARLTDPALTPAFVASGGWPNCSKPTGLPARTSILPDPVSLPTCQIPAGHRYTPPGTVCASCHNTIIAPALKDLSPPCAQPLSSDLPSIPTSAVITGALDDGGAGIAQNTLTSDATPELRGTLSAALGAGQSLSVLRNGASVGSATVNGTSWAFIDAGRAPDGATSYQARVVTASGFGPSSNTWRFTIDATPPAGNASISAFVDDVFGSIGVGGTSTDTTPGITGTLSAALGAGEGVRVLRNGVVVGTATVAGTAWTYTEPTALAAGTYSYQARSFDAAGNLGTLSSGAALTIVGGLSTVSITQLLDDANAAIPLPPASTSDSTPTLRGTLSAALPAGGTVRVRRNGAAIGTATVSGTTWSFTDPGAPEGSATYTLRVEVGSIYGSDASVTIAIDTVAPTQAVPVTGIFDAYNASALAAGATTPDTRPTAAGTLSAALAAGESVRVLRNGVAVGTATVSGANWTYAEPTALANGTYTYQAQVVDASGLRGPLSSGRTVTVNAAAVPLQNAATFLTAINGQTPVPTAIALNNNNRPTLAGTLDRALGSGEVLRVYNGNSVLASLTPTGTGWTYTPATALQDGTYVFRARIEQGAVGTNLFGAFSASVTDPIDATPPLQLANVTGIFDDTVTPVVAVSGNNTRDTTPRIDGSITIGASAAALSSSEKIRIYRSGTATHIAELRPTGNTWSYTETAALPAGTYTYRAQVWDDAGNQGQATGSTQQTTLLTSMPTAVISSLEVSGTGSALKPNGTTVASGGAIPDLTPTANITVSSLPAGYVLQLFRDAGTAAVAVSSGTTCATSCVVRLTEAANTTEGVHSYTARVVAGTAIGDLSAPFSVSIDVTAPTAGPTISLTTLRRPFQNASTDTPQSIPNGGTTSDNSPTVVADFAALAAGESVSITEEACTGTSACSATFPLPSYNVATLNAQQWVRPSTVFPTTLNHPADYTGSGSPVPSTTPGRHIRFTAIRYDAAGNASPRVSFEYTLDYLTCSAQRAYNKSSGSHYFAINGVVQASSLQSSVGVWRSTSTSATCGGGCHYPGSTAPTAPFVRAPGASGYNGDYYWCRRQ